MSFANVIKTASLCLVGLLLVTAVPAMAAFPYVVGSGWQKIDTTVEAPSPDGNGWGGTIDDLNDPNSTYNTPWTFNLNAPGFLKITDLYDAGDYYQVWDNMVQVVITPQVPFIQNDPNNPPDWADPDVAFSDPNLSHALLPLAAGAHSLNFRDMVYEDGTLDNVPPWFPGDATLAFRVDSAQPIPEPGTFALLGLGIVASVLGMTRRRK